MSQCSGATAGMWQYLLRLLYRKPHHIDKSREAALMIRSAISDLEMTEEQLKQDLKNISLQVKASQSKNMTGNVKNLLLSSRSKRKTLLGMQAKRQNLMRQSDMLDSCELNTKVMNSLKQTSSVLKDIGLSQHLATVDETMMDLQEETNNLGDITSALSQSIAADDLDETDLQNELDALMNDDFESDILPSKVFGGAKIAKVETPLVSNSMQDSNAVATDKMAIAQQVTAPITAPITDKTTDQTTDKTTDKATDQIPHEASEELATENK